MTDYLLQAADENFYPLLDLGEPLHRAFAQRHGLEYVIRRERVLPDWAANWDKVPLLLGLVQREDTDWVYWLDADVLIVGDADPREVMDGYQVGMSYHPGAGGHYNTGVIFMRACPQVACLLERVLASGPGRPPYYEQTYFNRYLAESHWAGQIVTLPHEWNSTVKLGHPEECVIRAWHGTPGGPKRRAKLMRAEIARRNLEESKT